MKAEELQPGMLIIRKAYNQNGPKSTVTSIHKDYAMTIHPDHGASRVYLNTLSAWEPAQVQIK